MDKAFRITIYADKEKTKPLYSCNDIDRNNQNGLYFHSIEIGSIRIHFGSTALFLKDGTNIVIEVTDMYSKEERDKRKMIMDGLTYKYPIEEIENEKR